MSASDLDAEVPYGEDLQSEAGAAAWVLAADQKRPWRTAFRELIAEGVATTGARRVLELGPGPGLLARCVLERCPAVHDYTLVDFSEPMLAMARQTLDGFAPARFVLDDFRSDAWTAEVPAPFDCIIAMQSVHEVRHKRHVARLYTRMRGLAASRATILICDHTPKNDSWPAAALFMTEQEQLSALTGAGFTEPEVLRSENGLVLYRGHVGA